jgi:hypothetical protein
VCRLRLAGLVGTSCLRVSVNGAATDLYLTTADGQEWTSEDLLVICEREFVVTVTKPAGGLPRLTLTESGGSSTGGPFTFEGVWNCCGCAFAKWAFNLQDICPDEEGTGDPCTNVVEVRVDAECPPDVTDLALSSCGTAAEPLSLDTWYRATITRSVGLSGILYYDFGEHPAGSYRVDITGVTTAGVPSARFGVSCSGGADVFDGCNDVTLLFDDHIILALGATGPDGDYTFQFKVSEGRADMPVTVSVKRGGRVVSAAGAPVPCGCQDKPHPCTGCAPWKNPVEIPAPPELAVTRRRASRAVVTVAALIAAQVQCVLVHDTATLPGPIALKLALAKAGYRLTEDAQYRPDERTERGMLLAVRE